MKRFAIFPVILSLVICTACAGELAQPTLLPAVSPTQEPTQEPTAAPTAPPLPAGPIDAELKWVGTLNSNLDISNVYKYWSRPLRSEKEIQAWLIDFFGADINGNSMQWLWEIDYSQYDDAFFAEKSIIVCPVVRRHEDRWWYVLDKAERTESGDYLVEIDWGFGVMGPTMSHSFFVLFIEMENVADSSFVEFNVTYNSDLRSPPEGAVVHERDEIAPGVLISYTRE